MTTDPRVATPFERVLLRAGTIDGKYRVERVLASGAMGVVVEAWHLHFAARVALKFLSEEHDEVAAERFRREARAMFGIKSEHVVRVLDAGELRGVPYIVMEYLEGTDLRDLMYERLLLPVADAVDFILQASEAIAEAHAIGIVHRDIKPENLFLVQRADGSPCIKVIDFGLSKFRDPGAHRLTATHQSLGTPQYMAPEQWHDAASATQASDQWALGAVLYELLTGEICFDGPNFSAVYDAVVHGLPVPPSAYRPHVPPELDEVIMRCLEKDPSRRFESISALALALRRWATHSGRVCVQAITARATARDRAASCRA